MAIVMFGSVPFPPRITGKPRHWDVAFRLRLVVATMGIASGLCKDLALVSWKKYWQEVSPQKIKGSSGNQSVPGFGMDSSPSWSKASDMVP